MYDQNHKKKLFVYYRFEKQREDVYERYIQQQEEK